MGKQSVKDFTGIDIVKFIASFIVIAIHIYPPLSGVLPYPKTTEWVLSMAVPFFFMVSGFLIARKTESKNNDVNIRFLFLHRSFHLFRIYVYWLLIYLPITVFLTINRHLSIWGEIKRYIFNALVVGESNYAWHLWFIYSAAIVFLILSLFNMRNRTLLISFFLIFLAIRAIGYAASIYFPCKISDLIYLLSQRPLGGGLYITAGMLLYHISYLKNFFSTLVCLGFSALTYVYNIPIYQLFGGVVLFNVAFILQFRSNQNFLKLRNLSMWIYFIHMYIIFAVVTISEMYAISISPVKMYLIVSVCTFATSILLNRISTKYSNAHWLVKLIK